MFDPNGPFMYGLVAVIILFVIAMSIRFIVLAWKRAKKLGMDPEGAAPRGGLVRHFHRRPGGEHPPGRYRPFARPGLPPALAAPFRHRRAHL